MGNVLKRDCMGEVMLNAQAGYTGGCDLQTFRALVRMLADQNRAGEAAIRKLIEGSPALCTDDYAALVAPEFNEIAALLKKVEMYALRAQNADAAERGRRLAAEPSGPGEPLFDDDVDVEFDADAR